MRNLLLIMSRYSIPSFDDLSMTGGCIVPIYIWNQTMDNPLTLAEWMEIDPDSFSSNQYLYENDGEIGDNNFTIDCIFLSY